MVTYESHSNELIFLHESYICRFSLDNIRSEFHNFLISCKYNDRIELGNFTFIYHNRPGFNKSSFTSNIHLCIDDSMKEDLIKIMNNINLIGANMNNDVKISIIDNGTIERIKNMKEFQGSLADGVIPVGDSDFRISGKCMGFVYNFGIPIIKTMQNTSGKSHTYTFSCSNLDDFDRLYYWLNGTNINDTDITNDVKRSSDSEDDVFELKTNDIDYPNEKIIFTMNRFDWVTITYKNTDNNNAKETIFTNYAHKKHINKVLKQKVNMFEIDEKIDILTIKQVRLVY